MEGFFVLVGLGIFAFLFVGCVGGIMYVVRMGEARRKTQYLESRIVELHRRIVDIESGEFTAKPTPAQEPASKPLESRPLMTPIRESVTSATVAAMAKSELGSAPHISIPPPERIDVPPPLPPAREPTAPPPKERSFEFQLGTKWFALAGIFLVIVSAGLFLRFAVANNMIGPELRLAIGVFAGVACIGIGEFIRRRDYGLLFQALTGGGIGIFYTCIYFAMNVYKFVDPSVSMAMAVLVTLFGVVMAVAHNAVSIAVLAVIGGFLSPILYSTGAGNNAVFFAYIAILDLVALGAAYYRRWRVLDILSFAGTTILFEIWFVEAYEPESIALGLVVTTVFYLMFLVIPLLHGLVRRQAQTPDGLTLVVVNALHALYAYYGMLLADHRTALGFVVIAQAALVFALFRVWSARVDGRDKTAESLLVIALALITLAVPTQLRFFGIPIAWSVEGALFIFLGLRTARPTALWGGTAALVLAVGGLLVRLPAHTLEFTPVFNRFFGSWSVVIAAMIAAVWILHRFGGERERYLKAGVFLLAYATCGALLTLEVGSYWEVVPSENRQALQMASLTALWAIIATATMYVIARRNAPLAALVPAWGAFVVGALFCFGSLANHESQTAWLFLNGITLAKLVFIGALFAGAYFARRLEFASATAAWEIAGHVFLALLIATEIERWGDVFSDASRRLAPGAISGAWALHALALVWYGLVSKLGLRRYLGFGLFAITVFKVLFYDMQELGQAARILSFLACGILLLVAAAVYRRFEKIMIKEEEETGE